MNKLTVLLLSIFVVVVHAGMAPPAPKKAAADLEWFHAAVRNADKVTIMEGLPHPYWEPRERERELSKHSTIKIGGESFYEPPLGIDKKSEETITRTLEDITIFDHSDGLFVATKQCGGFHADYAVILSLKDETLACALICFGCAEAKLTGEKTLLLDLSEHGVKLLTAELRHLQNLRPPWMFFSRQDALRKMIPNAEAPTPTKIELKP